MKTPQQAIISILEGIVNQIGALNPSAKWSESKKKIGGIFKKMATVGAKMAAGAVGIDGGVVDDFVGNGQAQSDINQLKEEIGKLINEALSDDSSKIGFTFYIDDLDRIDPPVAVEILELLKNIFDLEHCVFILAIDYDVVIKGLKPKFGELTEKNEREFRSFFDKIIQLPFSMPVASYNVDTFLVDALRKIEFFTAEELTDHHLAETLSEVARLSVGSNPRSLKRLTNTLSLISIINAERSSESDSVDIRGKTLNFSLVCMQIAYPYIYNQLTEEPDFKNWNERIASKLKLRHLTAEEKESLDATDEFDEDWEKVVFRMCQKEMYLSNRAFQVSQLLTKISEIVNDDNHLGEFVDATIALSAVTNLKAFDGPIVLKKSRALEVNKFDGKEIKGKGRLCLEIVKKYVDEHPEVTLAELKTVFNVPKCDAVVESLEKAMTMTDSSGKAGGCHYIKENDQIIIKEGIIVVWSYWPERYYAPFMDNVKKLGIKIG